MYTNPGFKIKALLYAALFSFSSIGNSMSLTFEASYNSKLLAAGTTLNPDLNFSPTSFQFQVNFDTSITGFYSQLSPYTYVDTDGNVINYTFQGNNTSFGTPTFSSSPFSSQLGSSLLMSTDERLWSSSSSFLNEGYNYYDSVHESFGYRGMGFLTYFQLQTDTNYDVYYMEVMLNLSEAPLGLSDVDFNTSAELISSLQLARDLGTSWYIDEFGASYQNEANRVVGAYFGSARLIAIDGVGTTTAIPAAISVPEPGTLALFMTGLALMGFEGRRRRTCVSRVGP
jgi:hypothetical protein